MSALHEYTEEFFEYIERGSIASAKRFSKLLVPMLNVSSILDVGCGRGAWLREWQAAGVATVHGVDGPYVRRDLLLIPVQNFSAVDLSTPFDLQRRFDLVSCLEVAEHLPKSCSETFVSSLVAHADMVLFSAAPPVREEKTTSTRGLCHSGSTSSRRKATRLTTLSARHFGPTRTSNPGTDTIRSCMRALPSVRRCRRPLHPRRSARET